MSLIDGLKHLISKTQENCKITTYNLYEYNPEHEVVGVYLHSSPAVDIGLKGAFVV